MARHVALWLLLIHISAFAAPQRIISLTPHTTELLFNVGAEKQIIATDSASDYPSSVTHLPKVANYQSINIEKILALKPDLIVAWQSAQKRLLEPLAAFHIPIFYSNPVQLDSLPGELRALGKLTGHSQQGDGIAQSYSRRLQELKTRYQHQTPISVFYELWDPPLGTVAQGSWIDEAISLCGGRNIFTHAQISYPQVSVEEVIALNPQVILIASNNKQRFEPWLHWSKLAAVHNRQLYLIDPDLLNRPTPRILDGVKKLCALLETARQRR